MIINDTELIGLLKQGKEVKGNIIKSISHEKLFQFHFYPDEITKGVFFKNLNDIESAHGIIEFDVIEIN